jgi:hypothetical protein
MRLQRIEAKTSFYQFIKRKCVSKSSNFCRPGPISDQSRAAAQKTLPIQKVLTESEITATLKVALKYPRS